MVRFKGFTDYGGWAQVKKLFGEGSVLRIRSAKLHSTLNNIVNNKVTPTDSIVLEKSKKVYHLDFES